MPNDNKTQLNIRIDKNLLYKAKILAKQNNRSLSNYIIDFLINELKKEPVIEQA